MNGVKHVWSVLTKNNEIRDRLYEMNLHARNGYEDYLDYVSEKVGYDGFISDKVNIEQLYNTYGRVPTWRSIADNYKLFDILSSGPQEIMRLPDTPLANIARICYSRLMNSNAVVAESRQRGIGSSVSSYITPYLYLLYGNNPERLPNLFDSFNLERNMPRINDDMTLGDKIHIIHSFATSSDMIDTSDSNTGAWYYRKLIKDIGSEMKFNMLAPYVLYSQTEYSNVYKIYENDKNEFSLSFDERIRDYRAEREYNEGDFAGTLGKQDLDEVIGMSTDSLNTIGFDGKKGIISKTNELFRQHKIATMIARTHTTKEFNEEFENGINMDPIINTAYRKGIGLSKGRNLLKKESYRQQNPNNEHGHDDPYCRVWTWGSQYDKYSKLIRPFREPYNDLEKLQKINMYHRAILTGTHGWDEKGNEKVDNGGAYLAKNTVLMPETGLVRITPHREDFNEYDYSFNKERLKPYMFSIENLAWKDVLPMRKNLSPSQVGPNGGRIMWFPPYGLTYSESVNVQWNSNTFVGRGEQVYTYSNTDRTCDVSFIIIADHPVVMDSVATTAKGDDDDILRFFAGCDVPYEGIEEPPIKGIEKNSTLEESSEKMSQIYDKNYRWRDMEKLTGETEPADPDGNGKNREQPNQNVPEQEPKFPEKTVTVTVYFPNNYSGHMRDENTVDEDWVEYLLWGHDNSSEFDTTQSRGYEFTKSGITTTDKNVILKGLNPKGRYGKADTESDGYKRYHTYYGTAYRVDQRVLLSENLELRNICDDNSLMMNTIQAGISNDYSFGEFVGLLALSDGENHIVHYNKWSNDKEKKKWVTDKNPNIDNYLKSSWKETFGVGNKITAIAFHGQASKDGNKESNDRLSMDRKNSIKKFLENSGVVFSELKVIEESNNTQPGETDYDVNNSDVKSNRYARFTIYLNYAENDRNRGVKYEEPEKPTNTEYLDWRYDNEYRFFKELKNDSPLVYKSLKEKFSYFTPAFHSLSPEGFHSRLTFLHQCTRQGHTMSTAEQANGYATQAQNLAFGRMPICVVRIGDFINTRAIIRSMSIQYSADGGVTWDMNPEGIGVQPMFAKVTLSLTIIGGQSLEAPISRLQNALSFNFYANTGVYDDRADRVSYGSRQGEYVYEHMWLPYLKDVTKTNNDVNAVEQVYEKAYFRGGTYNQEPRGTEETTLDAQLGAFGSKIADLTATGKTIEIFMAECSELDSDYIVLYRQIQSATNKEKESLDAHRREYFVKYAKIMTDSPSEKPDEWNKKWYKMSDSEGLWAGRGMPKSYREAKKETYEKVKKAISDAEKKKS